MDHENIWNSHRPILCLCQCSNRWRRSICIGVNRLGKKPYPLEAEPKWFSDQRDGRFCTGKFWSRRFYSGGLNSLMIQGLFWGYQRLSITKKSGLHLDFCTIYIYFVVCRVYWEPKSPSNHRIFHLLVRMLGNDYECVSKNKRISKDATKNYLASSWVVMDQAGIQSTWGKSYPTYHFVVGKPVDLQAAATTVEKRSKQTKWKREQLQDKQQRHHECLPNVTSSAIGQACHLQRCVGEVVFYQSVINVIF